MKDRIAVLDPRAGASSPSVLSAASVADAPSALHRYAELQTRATRGLHFAVRKPWDRREKRGSDQGRYHARLTGLRPFFAARHLGARVAQGPGAPRFAPAGPVKVPVQTEHYRCCSADSAVAERGYDTVPVSPADGLTASLQLEIWNVTSEQARRSQRRRWGWRTR